MTDGTTLAAQRGFAAEKSFPTILLLFLREITKPLNEGYMA